MIKEYKIRFYLDDRKLTVVVFSLFFSWLLAFPFEGQILYALAAEFDLMPDEMVFGGLAAHFAGLILCGFIIRTMKAAKQLMLYSIIYCILASFIFFFPPSFLWTVAIISSTFLTGGCVAAWGFFFRSGTPKNERIKTAADGLIFSNILMILLNTAAIHLSPHIGLGLSMLILLAAFLSALRLPSASDKLTSPSPERPENDAKSSKALAFLCLFIVVITIDSGLMYQVQGPAYVHLEWLTSWYWAVPYIVALIIMRNMPLKANRSYILYVAIAMIGFSFISFMSLDRSGTSYLVVNTLMLGACGVYDLFWWSILGEMLELDKNPAKVLGIGLSANVLGVLLGGFIGNAIASSDTLSPDSTLIALTIVCISLTLLPLLNKHLLLILKNHAYLSIYSSMPPDEQNAVNVRLVRLGNLSDRENQVAALLLQGKTYRTIAGELYISENTVKYFVKNIYSKFGIQSRSQLIDLVMKKDDNRMSR